MQLKHEQFRLLGALENGKVRTLRDIQTEFCPAMSIEQLLLAALVLQRQKHSLLKRVAADTDHRIDPADTRWLITIDGYFYLMEAYQENRRRVQKSRVFKLADGTEYTYRIRTNADDPDPTKRFMIQTRQSPQDAWTDGAYGLTPGHAIETLIRALEGT